jgi:hypothetical protein
MVAMVPATDSAETVPLSPTRSAKRSSSSNESAAQVPVGGTHGRRIDGVMVSPTSIPSGERNRVTVWPHGSFLFLTRT